MKSCDATVLMDAFDGVDPALLYNARVRPPVKQSRIRTGLMLAAACLVLIAGAAVYSIFLRTASVVTVDSTRSASLELNAAGYVIAVSPDRTDLNRAKGQSAPEAVGTVIGAMARSNALTAKENTVILGYDDPSRKDTLLEAANAALLENGVDGAVLSLCALPARSKPSNMTAGKYALLNALSASSEHLTADSLRRLSPTALWLLMDSMSLRPGGVTCTGTPSGELIVGEEQALSTALAASHLSAPEASVTLIPGDNGLRYLVTLKSERQGEAYFVDAYVGTIEKVVRSGADTIDADAANEASIPLPNTDASNPVEADRETTVNYNYNSDTENKPIPTAAPTERPASAVRLPYAGVPVTMKELSFVTLSPPNEAHEIPFDVLFEGQYYDASAVGDNTGSTALIDSYGAWLSYLDDHPYAYCDSDGNALDPALDEKWFESHVLIGADFDFKSAGNLAIITAVCADDTGLYTEESLDYGVYHNGSCCRALSLYAVSRSDLPADATLHIY